MDFHFTDEQLAVAEAARRVFDGHATPERVAEVEAEPDRFDRDLWAALARADLLGLAVPEDCGGGGLGLTELCLLLEAQGRRVAPVPLWPTLVLGALPLARSGSVGARGLLEAVVAGEALLSGAVNEVAASPRRQPAVTAQRSGPRWRLRGRVAAVPAAHVASAVVVPACSEDELLLTLVDPRRDDVRMEQAVTTNREIHPHLEFSGTEVAATDVLARGPAAEHALKALLESATTGLCALALGVAEEALARTASYLNERQQFGRPLSTFQGTMLRAADAFIGLEAMRVTLWQAAWRFDTGRDAGGAVEVAKWQASERGSEVVHATQHLHGGIGADITYPMHRYFLWGKQLEVMLGSGGAQRARLGHRIAEQARAEVAR